MEDIATMDAIERYLRGEMDEAEKAWFENLRRTNSELDQAVVEQHAFLNQLENYGRIKQLKHQLHQIHSRLVDQGVINENYSPATGGKLLQFWRRHNRTIAVAASIAGVTALSISAAVQLFTPKAKPSDVVLLHRKLTQLENGQRATNIKINQLIETDASSAPTLPEGPQVAAGTSFLIDGDGYLVTNYHVVANSSSLIVSNNGKDYRASAVHLDKDRDLAILKITDGRWQPLGPVPYALRKNKAELGEELFTLGYPRNSIVYNRGYLSAGTGYNDDSLSIQLTISANPGNSGGPVLDKNGNIVGILTTRDRQASEVVFASKVQNLTRLVDELKKDTAFRDLNLPTRSMVRNLDRVDQIKKIQDCVFMVKVY
jgi:S1-C subfamily serine protease